MSSVRDNVVTWRDCKEGFHTPVTSVEGESAIDPRHKKRNRIPVVLSVAAVAVVAIVLAFYLAPVVSDALTPYPSEDTSLTTYNGGVVWTFDSNDFSGISPLLEFSDATLFIAYPLEEGFSSWGGFNVSFANFLDYHEFDYSCSISRNLTTGENTEQGVVWMTFWILVNDANVNGAFDSGDSIAFFSGKTLNGTIVETGFVQDTEYALALQFEPRYSSVGQVTEYDFAFHEDRFYSWSPERLSNNWG